MIATQFSSGMVIQKMIIKKQEEKTMKSTVFVCLKPPRTPPSVAPSDETSCSAA